MQRLTQLVVKGRTLLTRNQNLKEGLNLSGSEANNQMVQQKVMQNLTQEGGH
jgi:hypothetical protein